MMNVRYAIEGIIEVPDGSQINDTSIKLPSGQTLRLWEAWELQIGEDYKDLTTEDIISLGCWYDGDTGRFVIEDD